MSKITRQLTFCLIAVVLGVYNAPTATAEIIVVVEDFFDAVAAGDPSEQIANHGVTRNTTGIGSGWVRRSNDGGGSSTLGMRGTENDLRFYMGGTQYTDPQNWVYSLDGVDFTAPEVLSVTYSFIASEFSGVGNVSDDGISFGFSPRSGGTAAATRDDNFRFRIGRGPSWGRV